MRFTDEQIAKLRDGFDQGVRAELESLSRVSQVQRKVEDALGPQPTAKARQLVVRMALRSESSLSTEEAFELRRRLLDSQRERG